MCRRGGFVRVVVVGVVAWVAAQTGCSTSDARIDAVVWIGGFAHEFEPAAEIMTADLRGRMPIEVSVAKDGSFLDSPEAEDLDVIIMHHCHQSTEGVLTEPQKQRLLELVRGGVGVVAIHASYYSFLEWEAYHDMFGAKWVRHGPVGVTLVVRRTDAEHPITRDVPDTFEMVSELYESTPLADDCHVLAVAREKDGGPEHPSVWTRMYGQGRIVTMLAGHGPDAFEVEEFQKLIAAGTRWAAGR